MINEETYGTPQTTHLYGTKMIFSSTIAVNSLALIGYGFAAAPATPVSELMGATEQEIE